MGLSVIVIAVEAVFCDLFWVRRSFVVDQQGEVSVNFVCI